MRGPDLEKIFGWFDYSQSGEKVPGVVLAQFCQAIVIAFMMCYSSIEAKEECSQEEKGLVKVLPIYQVHLKRKGWMGFSLAKTISLGFLFYNKELFGNSPKIPV